jgi:hypothetical protein
VFHGSENEQFMGLGGEYGFPFDLPILPDAGAALSEHVNVHPPWERGHPARILGLRPSWPKSGRDARAPRGLNVYASVRGMMQTGLVGSRFTPDL